MLPSSICTGASGGAHVSRCGRCAVEWPAVRPALKPARPRRSYAAGPPLKRGVGLGARRAAGRAGIPYCKQPSPKTPRSALGPRTSICNNVRRSGSSSQHRPCCRSELQHGQARDIAHNSFARFETPSAPRCSLPIPSGEQQYPQPSNIAAQSRTPCKAVLLGLAISQMRRGVSDPSSRL
jgi:hypothetical protein